MLYPTLYRLLCTARNVLLCVLVFVLPAERLFRTRYKKAPSFLSIHMGIRADVLPPGSGEARNPTTELLPCVLLQLPGCAATWIERAAAALCAAGTADAIPMLRHLLPIHHLLSPACAARAGMLC